MKHELDVTNMTVDQAFLEAEKLLTNPDGSKDYGGSVACEGLREKILSQPLNQE